MRSIDTPVGEARVAVAPARRQRLTLVLGHGAGGGIEAADLAALSDALPAHGVTVVRVVQPWRVAGRKVAAPPATLDVAWSAVLDALSLDGPVVVGGRSAGARVACRTARCADAVGCLALAFPLHPPGRPERSRLDELIGAGVPTLVVQGDRDAFGAPQQFPLAGPGAIHLQRVPFADHSMRVPKSAPLTQREALSLVVDAVSRWSRTLAAVGSATPDRRPPRMPRPAGNPRGPPPVCTCSSLSMEVSPGCSPPRRRRHAPRPPFSAIPNGRDQRG